MANPFSVIRGNIIMFVLMVAMTAHTSAQVPADTAWVSGYDVPGVDGIINTMLRVGDTLYVGGDFDHVGDNTSSLNVAMFDLKTRIWYPMGGGVNGASASVKKLVQEYITGDIIAVGKFTQAGGVPVTYVARWDGSSWGTLSGGDDGIDNVVNSAIAAYGAVFLGGDFTTAGGMNVGHLVSWSQSDGWDSLGGGVSGTGAYIEAMESGSNFICVGGEFSSAGGQPSQNIALYNTNSLLWTAVSPGIGGKVNAMTIDKAVTTSYLYIGGEFTSAGGMTANNIALMQISATPIWQQLVDSQTGEIGLDSTVNHLNWNEDRSDLIVAGDFQHAGLESVSDFVVWSGNSDYFMPLSGLGQIFGKINTTVTAVDYHDTLIVGGSFTSIDSLFCRNLAMQYGGDWQTSGDGFYDTAGAYNVADLEFVNAIRGYVCGSFEFAGGIKANGVVRYYDGQWQPLGDGIGDRGAAAVAVAPGTQYNGSSDTVYIGGSFDTSNGGAGTNIQMWANGSWHPLGEGISTGTYEMELDTSGNLYVGGFIKNAGGQPILGLAKWDGANWSDVGGGIVSTLGSEAVFDIEFDKENNYMYFIGQFDSVGGQYCPSHVAYWDGANWHTVGDGKPDDYSVPEHLGIGPHGDLYVSQNGVLYHFIDPGWEIVDGNDGRLQGTVNDIFVLGCDVYVVGNLLRAGPGGEVTLSDIVKWNGSEWDPFGSGVTNEAQAVQVISGQGYNDVIVGGLFSLAGGMPASRFTWYRDHQVTPTITWNTPNKSDTLHYGETAVFSWPADSQIASISVSYSTNGGMNWNISDGAYNASYGAYVWEVPSAINTDSAYFELSAGSGCSTEQFGPYTIRDVPGLNVVRIYKTYPDGTKLPYDPRVHGWNFGNSGGNMWPASYYENVDYSNLPVSDQILINDFSGGDSLFQDWNLFVNSYGDSVCYYFNHALDMNALAAWSDHQVIWGGSCFGFTVMSQAFYDHDRDWWNFADIFPEYRYVSEIPLDDSSRFLINTFQVKQGGGFRKHQSKFWTMNVSDVLDSLLTFMGLDGEGIEGNHPLLMIKNWVPDTTTNKRFPSRAISDTAYAVRGGHALLPYKVTNDPDSVDIYHIWVYDCNHPLQTNRQVRINLADSTWEYNLFGSTVWGYKQGIIPGPRWQAGFYAVQLKSNFAGNARSGAGWIDDTLYINTSTSEWNDIIMTTPGGDSLGQVSGAGLIRNSNLGIPIVDATPFYEFEHAPGYFFPDTSAEFTLSGFDSSFTHLGWLSDSTAYYFERSDADLTQVDKLLKDSAWTYTNPDVAGKNIMMRTVVTEPTYSWLMDLYDLDIPTGDSLSVAAKGDSLRVTTSGADKYASLYAVVSGDNAVADVYGDSILIPGGAIVTIIPDWQSLTQNDVLILTDIDRDDIYEDTTVMDIVTAVNDNDNSALPRDYALGQNYPNPFNPTTTVKYAVPRKSKVRIEVFNLLGQHIRTLVDEEKPAGVYEITWDGRNARGQMVASGMYFYRLSADDFQKSKKMILLK